MAKSIELPLVGAVTTEEIRETYNQLKQEGKKGVFIQTLGCQMNEHDTEKMLGLLKTLDYEPVQSILAADLILYNTCAVRENPERKLYGQINTLKQLKEQRPELIIGICGCMTQQSTALQRMQEELSHVDLIFGTHNIHRLPELVHRVEAGERIVEVWSEEGPVVEDLPVERASAVKAYVTIMYGCNQFCTYCSVIEDVRYFVHLDHKRTLPSGQIVRGAHASENPVYQGNVCRFSGYERTDVSHQDD
jgi:hypothetical protein